MIILALKQGFAEKESLDGVLIGVGALDFTVPFDEHLAGCIAMGSLSQADELLDPGVGAACDIRGWYAHVYQGRCVMIASANTTDVLSVSVAGGSVVCVPLRTLALTRRTRVILVPDTAV